MRSLHKCPKLSVLLGGMTALLFASLVLALPLAAQISDPPVSGQVQIPIDAYNRLIDLSRDPVQHPRPVPADFALGSATVTVDATQPGPAASGVVRVELSIDVFEDEWTLIPVLPAATPVESVIVGGNQVQLVPTPEGLAWITRQKGSHRMSLSYRIDAARSEAGFAMAVPLPRAASMSLRATLPGSGLDVTVIPAAGVRVEPQGQATLVRATVPTTTGVQIAWRTPSRQGHTLSRALYKGQLVGDAVQWSGDFGVELFTEGTVTLELLPRTVTLNDLKVDGVDAPILVEDGHFATLIRGRGKHRVVLGFQVPVVRGEGPPRVSLQVPQVPVSRFDLTLAGKKEITVTPAASVSSRVLGGDTVATVYAPMTTTISFAWAEAVPADIRAEVRANAAIFHGVYAEEGVLNVRALVHFEMTRGETSLLRLMVPPDVQVNRITSASGAVADWRIADAAQGEEREVQIFLDRKVEGELFFEVHYDHSLAGGDADARIEVPLLRAVETHRQRGMVALLSSSELTLAPVEDGVATRVGENQLPAFVRQAFDLPVAHTFKYVESPPVLVVAASAPERKEGRFDAQVDTLISLGEVTLGASAIVEINLKSGSVTELVLTAPGDVNILNLTGPSIRDYEVSTEDDGGQSVEVEFTQEMDGQFRLELLYERILSDGEAAAEVPTIHVRGAEVEQGRLAVEALSAVEVQVANSEQLTTFDIGELPRQLILRTTHPILLAFKYVQNEPPPSLTLKVTRHRLLDVQEAVIDRAEYRTLFTRDGLAVTIARFQVRNSRKQFLRIRLPANAEVWSAFVAGRPEQPALAENGEPEKEGSVLLKIVNSTEGFPVELIYATPGSKIRGLGTVRGVLPRPDILVTESQWDIYLPAHMAYRQARGNLDISTAGAPMASGELKAEMDRLQARLASQAIEPLRIAVPAEGVHYAFHKLYANQSGEDSWFAISYASSAGRSTARALSIVGALLLWSGLALRVRRVGSVSSRQASALAGLGAALLAVTIGFYRVSAAPAAILSLVVVLIAAAIVGRKLLAQLPSSLLKGSQ